MVFEPGAAGGAEAAVMLLRDRVAVRFQGAGGRFFGFFMGGLRVGEGGIRHGASVAPLVQL